MVTETVDTTWLEWNNDLNPPSVRPHVLVNGIEQTGEWRNPTWEEIKQEKARISVEREEKRKSNGLMPSSLTEALDQLDINELAKKIDEAQNAENPFLMESPKNFKEAFDAIVSDLWTIMEQRQRKYGKANILKCGDIGVVVHIADKEARIHNSYFDADGKPRSVPLDGMDDESLDDSFNDMANYAIIARMVRNGTFILPLGEK